MAILAPPEMGDESHDLGYESDFFELAGDEAEDNADAAAVDGAHADAMADGVAAAGDPTDDVVDAVNGRRSLRSRFDPLELGLHDGLADVPTVEQLPPAVGLLRSDERERRLAILRTQDRRRLELSSQVVRGELDVELAAQRLDESMFRLGLRHPSSFDAGYFDSAVAARSALVNLRERLATEAEQATGSGDDLVPAPPTVDEAPTAPAPSPIKATMEQRVAASRELGWSIKPHWFWLGSAILFLAEFPFTKAVVRQLLLEPNPPQWLQYLSTVSITVGFLIATKMTGLLLRRAQSMFLLASLIDPQRRPIVVRAVRRLRRQRPEDPVVAMDPTEQGLRFGAWGRLVMAAVLFAMLMVTVFSIANYRSDAAEAINAARQASGNESFGDTPQDDAAIELDAGAVPDVDQQLLQRVFVTVSLLNVIGAVILAWAATDGTHDVVGGDEDDEDDLADGGSPAVAGPTGPAPSRTRSRRRRRSTAVRLQDAVERRRETLKRRVVALEAARDELRQHEQATRTLVDLCKAQGGLDERAYWWANLAGRRFQVGPDTERRLSVAADPPAAPDSDIDLREGP
jgi:hypothetical protein